MSVEYNRKSAQPQQVRQVTIDPFTEGDTPDHLRRPKDDPFLSPFSSPSHDLEDPRPPDAIDDLFRRISSLIQTTQGRAIALCTTKGLSEAEVKGKMLDDFAQLSNAIWDAIYRQRTRTEASPQPREWMRKLLKLEDEKRTLETQARAAIEEATAELQDRLEACRVEISHLRETNAFLEQQNDSFSEQLAARLKPSKAEVAPKRPGVRRLERELNESIPKALAIARDLSLDSSSSAEPKHTRTNSNKEPKILPRKDQKDRSVSPSDRQIHVLKTELERCKSALQKTKQDKDRLQAWKDSYLRSPPQLTSALQQIEQGNEHEHKKLVGKTLILQHKLNAIQLGAQRFIRVSSSLLRFARDRDAVAQFEDARSELDVLLREIQRESKPACTSMSATPSGGSPSRFSSAIHTPEKRPEPDRALKSLEKDNRRLEHQLQIERKRADTFAEALEVTQREVEAMNGGAISPVLYLQQQELIIKQLKAQVKSNAEGKQAETEANKRIAEAGDQLRRALDQVQVLRTSNNALMQDLVAAKGDLSRAKELLKAEIAGICAALDTADSSIQAEFAKKDAALTRFKQSVFHRLRGYEATLVRLNSLFPSPTKDLPADTEEKQHLEYLLQRSEDLSAAKEAELQAFIDQQEGVAAGLRRQAEEWKEVAAQVTPLQEKVQRLEAALAGSQTLEADNQRLRAELNSYTAQIRQKEAACHQLQYEKHQLDATNAALMDESRTKSEDLLKAQMDFQRVISEANKRIEDLAQTLQTTQEELDTSKQNAAVLGRKKDKLRASRTQSTEQSAQLAQELLSLHTDLETCRGQVQAKEVELGTVKDLLAEQEKALEAAKQRITVLTAALEANQEEADKERVAAGRLTGELTAMRATAEDYSRKAELLSVDKAALKDALESLKAKHEMSSKDREERIQEVLSSLLHNQTRIKELEEDLALVVQERDTALLQLQDLQQTQATLRREAEAGQETDRKLHEVQSQVAELQRTKSEFEHNNERLTAEMQRIVGENKSQRERLDQLTAELAAAQKDKSLSALVTQLQREVEEGRQEVEDLRQVRQAKELAYSRAWDQSRTDLETAQKGLQELQTAQSSMKSEKEALETALNDLKVTKAEEISTLKEQLSRSKAAISGLEAERKRLEADMESINLALKEISAALEAAEKETDQIKAQRSLLTTELQQSEAAKAALELENSRLTSLEADLRREMELKVQQMQVEMEKNAKELQNRHKQVIEELTSESQQQINTLNSENKRLNEEIGQLKATNEEMEGIISLLQSAKQHLERSNEELRTQCDQSSEQLSTHTVDKAALSTALQTAESDRDSLLRQLAEARLAARQDRELLQLRIEQAEKDGKAAEETLLQCREDISATEKLLKAANERMELEQRTVVELRREKEGLLGQVRSLTGRLEEAFQQLATASKEQGDQSTRLRQELWETQQTLAETQLQLEVRSRDLLQTNTNFTQIREEKDRLSSLVSELLAVRDSLQQALDQKEAELQAASGRLQDLESDLGLKLSQSRATLQDTQSKLAAAQTGLEAYRRKAEGLEEECSQLEKELRATEERGEEAAAEGRKLRESVAVLEGKAAKLSGELNNALQMLGITRRETAETIDTLQTALKAAKAQKDALKMKSESLENDLRSSELSRETLEKELAGLQESLQSEKSESATRLKALQSDYFQQSSALIAAQEELESQKAELRAVSEAWQREREAASAAHSRTALQVTELTAANADLQGQVQTLEREKGKLALEAQTCSGRVGELEISLETAGNDFKRSCKEIDALKAALTASEVKVSSLEKEHQAALQTLGINRREQAESTAKMQASLKSHRDLTEEWERLKLQLTSEKELLAREVQEGVRNRQQANKEIEDLERTLTMTKEKLDLLEKDQKQREISLSDLRTAKETLEAQNQSLTIRLEEAFQQLQEEAKQRSSQGDQSAQLRQTLRETQQKLTETLQSCSAAVAAETSLKEQLRAEMGEIVADLRDLGQKKDAELSRKEEMVAKLEQEKVEFGQNVTRLSQELADLQIAHNSLSKQHSALADQLKTTEKDLNSEQNRSESLAKDLAQATKERNQLSEQLQKAEFSLNQSKTETDAVIKRLKDEISAMSLEAQQTQQQLQALSHSNEQLEGRKAELEVQIQLQTAAFQTSQVDFAKEKATLAENLSGEQNKSESLSNSLNHLNSELSQAKARVQDLNLELETALRAKNKLEHSEIDLKSIVQDQKSQINSLSSQLEEMKTANLAISAERKRSLDLENAISALKNEFEQLSEAKNSLESQNQSLEQRLTSVSSNLAAAQVQETQLNELNHYLEAENVKLEKQIADLTETKEALERANSEQESEIARLIEEVRRANSGETGEEVVLGSLRSESGLGNLSGLGPMEEEKLSSADSLDLGAAYNAMPRQDTQEEPLESDPPIHIEEGEIPPERLVIEDLSSLLEAYRNPQDDLIATVRKLLEEFELMKKNPARNVIPRLNLRSQRETKESQTSPRDELDLGEERKGSSNADSASVELDKSVGGSEAADQDTPRQKILPELWMKPVAHKIQQAKGSEATALRSKVKSLEQDLQEERTIAEHLNVQNRLLKEEVAEKARHIKRLEVAETAGEKSPVNIEHLKDVLVKLIMQLPKQAANAETLINTIFSVLFLTPQDVQHIEDARKGVKKKLFGLFK